MPGLARELLAALDDAALAELATRLRPFLRDDPERLLDAREAGARLGLHPETLSRMARQGRVWSVKVGREWRFNPERLEIKPMASQTMSAVPSRRSRHDVGPDAAAAIRGAA